MPRALIDGISCELPDGSTVLDAARAAGRPVPTLCHDDRLRPLGGCRLCLVRIDGASRPVPACATPLRDGMVVEAVTPGLEEMRRGILELQARTYPAAAVERQPDEPFHRLLARYGVAAQGRDAARRDDSHPYIAVDMARCVSCFRCVRICEEVQGQYVWQAWGRGPGLTVVPDAGGPFGESSCVSCGACADTCPTGAIADKSVLAWGEPEAWTRTVCPYCGVGCEMEVGTRGGRIVQVRPAAHAPVNRGHLCVKGRYAWEFVHSAERATRPMIREKGGSWREVSWDEAVAHVARGLSRAVAAYGPGAVGILGSARGTNEESYLAQKLARAVLGTNNTDCCARVCHAPSAAALKRAFGTGAATGSFDDIERARTLLLCGANATENHPVVGARIQQAALAGTRLIVVDPRRIELASYADVHLQIRPGTNVPLFNAMAHVIFEEGLADEAFLAERAEGLDRLRAFLAGQTPEWAAGICGVDAGLIREAARLYATERPAASFHGLGLTEQIQGTDAVLCLANLALLTGNVGRPGTGVNPLRGQNNVQGSAHMGCEPASLPGGIPLTAGSDRAAAVWGVPVPAERGLTMMEMLDAAESGRFKALWAIGYDVLLTLPHAEATRRALEALDLLIVQDLFLNETARELATVFLPACSTFERDGTFMNGERRVQRVRQVLPPLGGSKPDWEVLCLVARALGRGDLFPYRSAEEVWDEVRQVWSDGAGITYARLEQGGLQWPCPSEDHPGTTLLHTTRFPRGQRAMLHQVPFHPTPEAPSADFPFVLMTGRVLSQFNAGTMTGRTRNREIRPADLLDISLPDAARLGLSEGDRVRLRSRYGETELPVHLTAAVRPGELFATFHTREAFVNRTTGPHRDPATGTPEYKITAVTLERVS